MLDEPLSETLRLEMGRNLADAVAEELLQGLQDQTERYSKPHRDGLVCKLGMTGIRS